MEKYKNLSGNSNVKAYQIGNDSITIRFKDGSVYLYTYLSAGRSNVGEMKNLAIAGKGLDSYIKRHVKKSYAEKLK